jgi:aminomethyltransferase
MQEDAILLQTAADLIPALMTMLDHFIIMDDVELAPLDARHGLLLTGPDAPTYLHALDLLPPSESCIRTHTFAGCPLDLIYAYQALVPTYEFWSDPATIAALTVRLAHIHAAPVEATPADLESLRILSGTPLYGTDIRNSETAKDLPQETNQTRALHFAKGCYLGQEIVERIRSRGAVHRTFTGFLLEGIKPEPGTGLQSDEKTIGELTSVARIGPSIYALGYIRREALERKATITYPGGIATPAALPFLLPEMSA